MLGCGAKGSGWLEIRLKISLEVTKQKILYNIYHTKELNFFSFSLHNGEFSVILDIIIS